MKYIVVIWNKNTGQSYVVDNLNEQQADELCQDLDNKSELNYQRQVEMN